MHIIISISLTVFLSGKGGVSRRLRVLAVAGHNRTGVGGVWREANHCEWAWLGGGLGEGGRGGGAGEGVASDDSITQSHRWRGPGEGHLSLSSSCHKHLWSTSWGGCEHTHIILHMYMLRTTHTIDDYIILCHCISITLNSETIAKAMDGLALDTLHW